MTGRGGSGPRDQSRQIPGISILIPAAGLGTDFDFGRGDDPVQRAEAVVSTPVAGGGSVIDTASTDGTAETVLGTILAETGLRPWIFIAFSLSVRLLPALFSAKTVSSAATTFFATSGLELR